MALIKKITAIAIKRLNLPIQWNYFLDFAYPQLHTNWMTEVFVEPQGFTGSQYNQNHTFESN